METSVEKKGLIHVYCGDGKGKTTAALGLALRAHGRGIKSVIARFLKTEDSGEVLSLKGNDGIRLLTCPQSFGFSWQMSPAQKQEAALCYSTLLKEAFAASLSGKAGLLILDEAGAALNLGFIDEEALIAYLKARPQYLEVVLTGRSFPPSVMDLADYITRMQQIRHPYTRGIPAREGIEY